jgi:hypothetical protein
MSYLDTARKAKEALKRQARSEDRGTLTTPSPDATEGQIIAVLIDSAILGAPIWFALDDGFESGDDIPVFFASELPFLQKMSAAELRRRYADKRALGGGWIRERIESIKH